MRWLGEKITIMYFLGLKPKSYHNSIQTQQFNTKQIEDTNQNQPKNQGMRQKNKRTKQNQEMTRQNQKNQDMEQEMKQVKKK